MIRDAFLGMLAFAAIVVLSVVFFATTQGAIQSPCERPLVEWPGCMMPR
jgi:hypothetical protein